MLRRIYVMSYLVIGGAASNDYFGEHICCESVICH